MMFIFIFSDNILSGITYQPVRFAAGLGREVEVIVTFSRLQVIQSLTDCLVGKAAYPQAHKWFSAVQVMEDIAED